MIFRSRKHHARHRVEVTVEANVEEGVSNFPTQNHTGDFLRGR